MSQRARILAQTCAREHVVLAQTCAREHVVLAQTCAREHIVLAQTMEFDDNVAVLYCRVRGMGIVYNQQSWA